MKEELEKQVKNAEMVSINEIANTPFSAIKFNNGKYSIVCGKTKLDTEFEELKDVIKYVKSKPYNLIGLLVEAFYNYYNLKK